MSDQAEADAGLDRGLLGWLRQQLPGEISGLQRQGRGRPAWFITVGAQGDTRRYYLRCDRGVSRGINQFYPLSREYELLRRLNDTDVPVPHTLAYNDEYQAILQEHVEGEVFFHHIADADERERVGDDFMRALARLHSLSPQDLDLDPQSYHVPDSPRDHAWHDLELWARVHYDSIEEPEPFMTYTLQWLQRFVPDRVAGTVIVQGDTGPGQFIFRDGKVAAIVDWEYAHWGCPMEDLAEIRQRDLLYPFGDMQRRFQVYEEASGTPLDMELIYYYPVRSLVNTPLALIGPELLYPNPHADIAERLAWNALFMRVTAEALAEAMNIDLRDEVVEVPTLPPQTMVDRLYDALVDDLELEQQPHQPDEYLAHRLRSTTFLAKHLRQLQRLGPLFEQQELDEVAPILGYRPQGAAEARYRLEARVKEGLAEFDEPLIRYFYRYARRQELLLDDAMLAQGDQGKVARLQLLRAQSA